MDGFASGEGGKALECGFTFWKARKTVFDTLEAARMPKKDCDGTMRGIIATPKGIGLGG